MRDGVPEISALAVADDGSAVGTQNRDSITLEQVNWVGFPVE